MKNSRARYRETNKREREILTGVRESLRRGTNNQEINKRETNKRERVTNKRE